MTETTTSKKKTVTFDSDKQALVTKIATGVITIGLGLVGHHINKAVTLKIDQKFNPITED